MPTTERRNQAPPLDAAAFLKRLDSQRSLRRTVVAGGVRFVITACDPELAARIRRDPAGRREPRLLVACCAEPRISIADAVTLIGGQRRTDGGMVTVPPMLDQRDVDRLNEAVRRVLADDRARDRERAGSLEELAATAGRPASVRRA